MLYYYSPCLWHRGPLAQRSEHSAHNRLVPGSNPGWSTNKMENYPSGWRGRSWKPIGGASPARVQIPNSPPSTMNMLPKFGPKIGTIRREHFLFISRIKSWFFVKICYFVNLFLSITWYFNSVILTLKYLITEKNQINIIIFILL